MAEPGSGGLASARPWIPLWRDPELWLGGLGQACLRTLMGFDAEIYCIYQRMPRWGDGVLADLQAQLAVECVRLIPPPWQLKVRRCRPHCNRFEAQALLGRYLAQPPGEVARYLDAAAGTQRTEPTYQAPCRQL